MTALLHRECSAVAGRTRRTPRSVSLVAALAASALLTLTACSSAGDEEAEQQTPEEVLATAKQTLDETPGVRISLATADLPSGTTGIQSAEGVGVRPASFEGSITVVLAGQALEVPVIAVDGKVYAEIPFTPGWSDIDPGDYGAPDPAGLISTEAGFSSLLPATTAVEEGESVRGGANNDEVLTEYTGSVPDTAVKNVIPSASGDFDATYTVTEDGELREVVLTGAFYGSSAEPNTYTIGFEDYGTEQEITAP